MKNLIQKFINLLLYGNLWIAGCAVAMVLQTEYILTGAINWDDYAACVFAATLFIYALHRVIGLQKLSPFRDSGRFLVINRFKYHIWLYAGIAGLACLYFFLRLSWWAQVALVIPAFLSVGYALPVFGKQRRLRDFHFVKIFLIAGVWSWVTVLIPAVYSGLIFSGEIVIMMLERVAFVFAIAILFDIRDLGIDQYTQVRTIPTLVGVKKAKLLGYSSLALMLCLVQINIFAGFYTAHLLFPYLISALSTAAFIYYASSKRHDYFYSAGVDGMLLLQSLLVYIL